VFSDARHFAVHPPLPLGAHFSDEGAANHMRLAPSHGEPGLNVFVHGAERGGRFPERQTRRAGEAVARLAGLGRDRAAFALQSAEAIQAGAFHTDVVAVANETLLFAHPQAFATPDALFAAIRRRVPGARIVEVAGVSLGEAVSTYLFNSQIVTLPSGGMALVLPAEVKGNAKVWKALDQSLGRGGPIARVEVVDVRESMRNGGGPACLRLRVPVSAEAQAAIHPGYILTPRRWEALARLVESLWPDRVTPADLTDPALWDSARSAQEALQSFIDQAV
jgi:succinylarginine dihydrolase